MASKLEEKFFTLWMSCYPQILLLREQCIIPKKKFRFDFIHETSKIAIEINGGIFIPNTRHNSGVGLQKEYVKHNLALINGWGVFTLASGMICREWVDLIAGEINKRIKLPP